MQRKPALSDLVYSRPPRLLVSVRSVDEAAAAIRGGCDILDVKEPHHGSLGMAAPDILDEIAQYVRTHAPQVLLSAALGEVRDYQLADAYDAFPASLPDFDLVKLGCADLTAAPTWQATLQDTRRAISRRLHPTTNWVAVAYADEETAAAPGLDEVIAEALTSGCRGVLIDTYSKSGRGLLDWIAEDKLQRVAVQLRERNLFLALAGSLKREDLARLKEVLAGIVAIRGAACTEGLRTDSVQETAVRDFRTALNDTPQNAA